jgi:hypothetical protein
MIEPADIDMGVDVARAAQRGAPLALEAVGRMVGLGAPERDALGKGKIPGWIWFGVALTVGFVVGVRVQKAYPRSIPRLVAGGR